MTARSIFLLHCDADCATTAYSDNPTTAPDGWRVLRSTNHIPIPQRPAYTPRRGRATGPTYTEQCAGSFTLHLCPDHTDTFNDHLPRTNGVYIRGSDSQAYVSCSCGASFGRTGTGFRIASADMTGPAHYTEKAWWRHLPAALQQYAHRDETKEAR